jgi:Immunity protein 21
MKWIETTGGPLVVLPHNQLENWNGIEGDYQRACEIDGYLGLIEVGGTIGVVLGDEPMRTTISNDNNSTAYIIRWCFAPNEKIVLEEIHRIGDFKFPKSNEFMPIDSSLVVFDSSLVGNKIPDSDKLSIDLIPGKYEVSTCLHKPDSTMFLVVHRLQKL